MERDGRDVPQEAASRYRKPCFRSEGCISAAHAHYRSLGKTRLISHFPSFGTRDQSDFRGLGGTTLSLRRCAYFFLLNVLV